MKKFFCTSTLRLAGKILTLMGFSLVFAACYAPAPYEPTPVIDGDDYYIEEPTLQQDESVADESAE